MKNLTSGDYIQNNENIRLVKTVRNCEYPVHTHEFIEIVYVCSGSGNHLINGKSYNVEKGDIVLLNIGDNHLVTTDNEIISVNILINPQFVDNELTNSHDAIDLLTLTSFREFSDSIVNFPPKIKLPASEFMEIENIIFYMLSEFDSKKIGYREILKNYLNVFLSKIFRIICREDSTNFKNNFKKLIPEILDFIEENYQNKITLTELAKNSFYNPSYFGQIFKECFGITPIEYVNRKRIEESIRILRQSAYSIDRICSMVGFNDKKQFYKIFKKQTGHTPGYFRKNL